MPTYWAGLLLLPATALLFHAAGAASNGLDEDPELSLNSVDLGLQQQLHHEQHQQHDVLDIGDELQSEGGPVQRRFECPAGFFRLRRNCYYLSGGTAQWREAHFQCTARNSTLAVLSRSGKDKILRKYLMGDQFRRLERWIGGIYNWRQMNWEWGVSGEKVLFENFGKVDQPPSANFMSCIVLDPTQEYKWNSRSCVEQKYFICEVPAGRIGKSRRRKNISDPLAPQNQRLRPFKNDRKHKMNRSKKGKLRSMRKNEWYLHDDNQIWIHGIKPGSRAPKGSSRRNSTKRQRAMQKKGEAAGRQRAQKKQQRKHQIASSTESQELQPTTPGPKDSNSFSNNDIRRMQHLSDDEVIFPRLSVNDFAREEILLKL